MDASTPVKLYGEPEIHRVSQHYSCQSEVAVVVLVVVVFVVVLVVVVVVVVVVVIVVVVMMIIAIITILLALQRTRFTAAFNLFCRGDLARNHQAYNRGHLELKYVTFHAKTLLTVGRFLMDSRSYVVH